ncbi:hypothetical protein SPRG_08106 [Saprolegnia parasitica CBS 223.65]|uniref:Uncharacterized protein n=1 Tax=Saprolegnia parasitica (strain CBS 223.65) TaxID=695850 RepID=A0A067CJV5_SAPPC|nr:hypothetical protein SPRG_08106 [Saprolegnia parasitica CBS 223.65]KDO26816.1 hypothetical protein SPRG_08106 [Saprolegnia parasitica CBS 223.65]|eukprot:XP_012202464.1 hypothetical protein SPRG_08106 [Saprolegnia parasitica CBS 223.65]
MQIAPGTGPGMALRLVRFNKTSILFSCAFLLNLALMPLKAYTTEPLPWTHLVEPTVSVAVGPHETFAAYEARTIAFYRPLYTAREATTACNYVYDTNQDVDILWCPLERATNSSFTFVGIPGSTFYSIRARNWVFAASVGLRNTSTTAFVELGTVFGLPSSVSAVWIDGYHCIYFAAQLSRGPRAWLYCKFGFRVGMTLLILYRLWTTYYVHYRSLARALRRFGAGGFGERLEIIVGDPTCLILQNTWICVLFVIDFWCSLEVVGQCFVRIGQTQDLWTFALATLYLSRTVWFAYLTLNVSGYVLRRCASEHRCAQADPTSVAVAVAIAVGPVTYLQLRIPFFIDVYHFLFTCLLPPERYWDYKEDALPVLFYSMLIGFLPLAYGLGTPILRSALHRFQRVVWVQSTVAAVDHSLRRLSVVMTRSLPRAMTMVDVEDEFGQVSFNDWKHRLLFALLFGCCRPKQRVPKVYKGGSIYVLFTTHRHYQRNAAFSFRGSDCYVVSHTTTSVTSYRLSLIDALHLPRHAGIACGVRPTSAFGQIVYRKDGMATLEYGTDGSHWIL